MTPPQDMRWWGWGEDGHDPELSPRLAGLLRSALGVDLAGRRRRARLSEVELPDRALPGRLRERLAAIGVDVAEDRRARVGHAYGRSYPDCLRLRGGDGSGAPDAVLRPGSPAEVQALLAVCAQERVAVVPFGGGTSVVGGVEGLRGGFEHVVSVDLARLDRVLAVDATSRTAVVEAGVRGPALEAALAAHGLTFGHFPQSFEYSSVGGWLATRSSGQASTGYGRADALALGLRCATPVGPLDLPAFPASAAGPDLRELMLGSEGTLGIISEATLQLHAAPRARRYEGWAFRCFADGADALRALTQDGPRPDVARLSDERETAVSLAAAPRALTGYLRARGRGALLIVGWEGSPGDVLARRVRSARVLHRHGGTALGARVGAAWEHGRFHGPYLRETLLDRGVLVDTLETATDWSRLADVHAAVGEAIGAALAGRGTPAQVLCHVSHLYPTGASLYFTFLARQETGAELEQWHAAKAAASEAILAAGATITHHHAVGRDHAPWLAGEVGEHGVAALRAAKAALDPVGIMNPGKLLDGAPLPGAEGSGGLVAALGA
jgi:alkyldihydroxyacetonephosphate synthase